MLEKILIVDDMPVNIKVLGELLKEKYELIIANNGQKAVQISTMKLPDLILMDIVMPEMDGIAACRALKENPETAEIPIIFITANNEREDVVRAFDAGGVDYITKPFNALELHARVKTHIELKQSREELKRNAARLENLNKELRYTNLQLNDAIDNLHVVAMTDPLTGLGNRRYITEKIQEEIIRIKRNSSTFTLMIADIDHFKAINDTYGHECGDYVLKHLAKIFRKSIREQDIVARWGGEEFLFLLPETDLEGAKVIGEKLRVNIEETSAHYHGIEIAITMTFGATTCRYDEPMDSAIKRADQALYTGKENGRNRVVAV